MKPVSPEEYKRMLKDDWDSIWDSEPCKAHREESARMEGLCPLRRARGEGGALK